MIYFNENRNSDQGQGWKFKYLEAYKLVYEEFDKNNLFNIFKKKLYEIF
jgi:hypothetical protein